MGFTAAASGFVVFLLSVQGTVYLHLHFKAVSTSENTETPDPATPDAHFSFFKLKYIYLIYIL